MNYLVHTFLHRGTTRGFTLVETLVSAFIISLVVLGPLTVAVNSSTYAKETKDVLTATYLGEEAVELLRHQQDSIYIRCLQATGTSCPMNTSEAPREAAWRIFKARLGATPIGSSCMSDENATGCSYDAIDLVGSEDTNFKKYVSSDGSCSTLSITSSSMYVCTGTHGSGVTLSHLSRSVSVTSVPTIPGADQSYNDDLRVMLRITFVKPNGYSRTVKVVDFLHPRA